MSLKPEPLADEDFVCGCEDWMRSACNGPLYYEEDKGKRYCVLHFPANEKGAEFREALKRKLAKKDFGFSGVWFPEADFRGFSFNEEAAFSYATFNGEANFRGATFNPEADFTFATFNGVAAFSNATFNDRAAFSYATFKERAAFREAIFEREAAFDFATLNGPADFREASLNGRADFSWVTFKEYIHFEKAVFVDTSSLNLQFARIEEPEHVFFHLCKLRPHWFVNTDPRKFHFTNVNWDWRPVREEVKALRNDFSRSEAYQLLSIACRRLAVNCEENHDYENASKFRYMSMDAGRREHWHGFAFWKLSWWYWAASGYGERIWQAAVVLVGLWALFTCIFFFGQRHGQWWQLPKSKDLASTNEASTLHDFREAAIYSLNVMALQKPEPLPANKRAKTFVLLATILGPLQAALLALAIRRKFMR